jgi:hypothetical protein
MQQKLHRFEILTGKIKGQENEEDGCSYWMTLRKREDTGN